MFELLMIAGAGVAGFLLGRKTAPCPKDHETMVAAMAFLSPEQRAAVLGLPALEVKNPVGQGTIAAPVGLFTADEKKAILAEVQQFQKDHPEAKWTTAVLVTDSEIAMKPTASAPAPARAMGIPVRYLFQN